MGSAAMHAVLFGVAVYLVSMYGPGYGVSYEGFQDPAADWAAAKARYKPLLVKVNTTANKLRNLKKDGEVAQIEKDNAVAAIRAEKPMFLAAKDAARAAGLDVEGKLGKKLSTNLLTSVLSSGSTEDTEL